MMTGSADLFLAWKYFKPKRSAVSVITLISVIGVALGVGVLIVVLAVMTGFSDKMKEKLLETTSHAQIYSRNGGYIPDPEQVRKAVEKNGGSALPVVVSPVLLQIGERFVPKQLIAFDADAGAKQFKIGESVERGRFSLERGEMMVSYLTARDLEIQPGSKVLVHSPSRLAGLVRRDENGKLVLSERTYLPGEFRVPGTFAFGKYDFDRDVIFLNLEDADELFGLPLGAATGVYVWTADPFHMEEFLENLKKDLPACEVYSWQELNGRLLGVLNVEKNMQFFLLVFIVLVAAFSITNTLITTVIQKTREIGVLKSMGATSGSVMRIFILQGFFVGWIGTVCGIGLGVLVVHYRMAILRALRFVTGQEIFPKEFYFFSELPAHIVTGDVLWIAVISILLCTFGGVIPAFRAAKLDPAGALRYE